MTFCTNCGQQLTGDVRFCSECGQQLATEQPRFEQPHSQHTTQQGGYSIPADSGPPVTGGYTLPADNRSDASVISSGFSARMQDPAIQQFTQKNKRAGLIFMGVLALIALIAIFIFAGESLGLALLTWLVVVSITALLGLFSSRKNKEAWDGVLEDKRVETQRNHDPDHGTTMNRVYVLYFRTSAGKRKRVPLSSGGDIFDYYQAGDPVRKHPNFAYPEKYHKQSRIICLFCGRMLASQDEQCPKCKLPAIK